MKTDDYLWEVRLKLWDKYGIDAGNRLIYPLTWYINTGRDCYDFRHRLLNCKPFLIARDLAKGGSYDEALKRIKTRIGFTDLT